MYSSKVLPMEEWVAVAALYEPRRLCMHCALPARLFCGTPAVNQVGEPRCTEHQRAGGAPGEGFER
jgi:hypothetical protein